MEVAALDFGHEFSYRSPLPDPRKGIAVGSHSLSQLHVRTGLACALWAACVFAAGKLEARNFARHSGYLESVAHEREMIVEDLVIVGPPETGMSLRERIFNAKLTKEFTDRYEQKFGRTEQQRAYLASNNQTYYTDPFGFQGTPQEINNERRRFGEFMIRRLAEHHVENYAKHDPKARVVWEAKEKLSNVRLAIGRAVKVNAKYSLSGNSADIHLQNPWVGAKVTTYFGDSFVRETVISLSRGITPTIVAETHVAFDDGIVSLIGRKSFTAALSGSLTASTYTHHGGVSRRESLYLAGLGFSY